MASVRGWMSAAAVAAVTTVSMPSVAGTVSFTSAANTFDGQLRHANAVFNHSGTSLKVTLSNIGGDVTKPVGILTALFFDYTGPGSITKVTNGATVAPGSSVVHFTSNPSNVSGEWAFRSDLAPSTDRPQFGISSAGFGLFGPGDRFGTTNLQGPASPNGLQFGITSINDNINTGNTPVTGANALIKHAVVFEFTVSTLFDLTKILNVGFQYGTALNEGYNPGEPDNPPPPPVVPVPPAFGLGVLGLLGVGLARRRLSKR
ncbi:MAG: PEP-CTERM sorting domain-containing protein [Phycisphaeraceae bacterium]|nr:hypothetical protein [Phycisphaerales bacterium]QOJ17817.1 MAG: PEP-CTERM sorting domain-containing protein [Phycisphaeraceae bacterium]